LGYFEALLERQLGSHYNLAKRKECAAMQESTITAKGQTTIPVQIRERIGVAPGTRLVWHVMPDGGVIVRAKTGSILDLAGALKSPKGKHVAVEKMNAWR